MLVASNKKIISVIIPVYNIADYLTDCIVSVINQDYHNIECILVDDGSKDASSDICRDFASKDSRIVYIQKDNGGLSSARNAGLDKVSGDYIFFLDGDDWLQPEALSVMLKVLECENCEIVSCGVRRVYENGVEERYTETGKGLLSRDEALEDLVKRGHFGTISCGKLYKKRLFDNLRFPVKRIHEDEFITYKTILRSNYVYCVDEMFYNYRYRKNSLSNVAFGKGDIDYLEALLERTQVFMSHGYNYLAAETSCMILERCFYYYKHNWRKDLKDEQVIMKLNEIVNNAGISLDTGLKAKKSLLYSVKMMIKHQIIRRTLRL